MISNVARNIFLLLLTLTSISSYNLPSAKQATSSPSSSRRSVLLTSLLPLIAAPVASQVKPQPSQASGGATAGKYTTIPIAKRRYYGRVQQSIHEYLLLGPAIVKGDMQALALKDFLDPQGIVVVEGLSFTSENRKNCLKKADGGCKGEEIRDSKINDMRTSMYLLGNAFRFNQQKAPENLPTVKAAKSFFKTTLDVMEKELGKKNPDVKKVQKAYVGGLDVLDTYLDLVELPPVESGNYDKTFERGIGANARIT
ncbi:hypothetical protein TrVE_jg7587 [Triparma verrucosa]|uniref:Uncharacterized protein n=2 Tax=Triparma TaxID=722752 RepID=A0A9W6ZHR3_9STRA|nr:hypothetical protein TrST_g3857 [Triparma strigata]GMI15182.1 hypothetical protein TrVE_jg7587 [Triparma verrucosa]